MCVCLHYCGLYLLVTMSQSTLPAFFEAVKEKRTTDGTPKTQTQTPPEKVRQDDRIKLSNGNVGFVHDFGHGYTNSCSARSVLGGLYMTQ